MSFVRNAGEKIQSINFNFYKKYFKYYDYNIIVTMYKIFDYKCILKKSNASFDLRDVFLIPVMKKL